MPRRVYQLVLSTLYKKTITDKQTKEFLEENGLKENYLKICLPVLIDGSP